jgi:protein N-terminal methyltransferase
MSEQDPAIFTDTDVGGGRSLEYWRAVSADVDGMLGGIPSEPGFSSINKVDLQGSRNFLAKLGIGLKPGRRRVKRAMEGGAG